MYMGCSYIYNIEHRNLEIRKTRNDFSFQVRNILLPLSLKVLRHKERDTHSFYSGFFICLPISCGTCLRPRRRSESRPFPFGVQFSTELTDFFEIHKVLHARASCAWRHSHPLVNISLGFLFDIYERHILPARALTHALKFAPN